MTAVRRFALAALLFAFVFQANAQTRIEIQTNIGTISLTLLDSEKPLTVANFLSYVQSGRYDDSFAHRLAPGFVFQSGGFTLEGGTAVTSVETFSAVPNEFDTGSKYSNVFGTIAMAKLGGDPNSATSQWFLNLGDNVGLDTQNGGFTVFGYLTSGTDVLQRLNTTFADANTNADGVYNASSALGSSFSEMPLLAPFLTANNLISTRIVVVPEPTPTAFVTLCALYTVFRRRRRGWSWL